MQGCLPSVFPMASGKRLCAVGQRAARPRKKPPLYLAIRPCGKLNGIPPQQIRDRLPRIRWAETKIEPDCLTGKKKLTNNAGNPCGAGITFAPALRSR